MNDLILTSPMQMVCKLDFPAPFHVGKFNRDKANEVLFAPREKKKKRSVRCLIAYYNKRTYLIYSAAELKVQVWVWVVFLDNKKLKLRGFTVDSMRHMQKWSQDTWICI